MKTIKAKQSILDCQNVLKPAWKVKLRSFVQECRDIHRDIHLLCDELLEEGKREEEQKALKQQLVTELEKYLKQ